MNRYGGILCLCALVVIAPLLAWKLAIGPTFGLWRQLRHDAAEISAMEAARTPEHKSAPAEAAPEMIQSGVILEKMLPALEVLGTAVEKYTPYITSKNPETAIHTAMITLRGDYVPLIKTIGFMEKDIPSCRIASVAFRSSTLQNKQTVLLMTVVVEQLIIKRI